MRRAAGQSSRVCSARGPPQNRSQREEAMGIIFSQFVFFSSYLIMMFEGYPLIHLPPTQKLFKTTLPGRCIPGNIPNFYPFETQLRRKYIVLIRNSSTSLWRTKQVFGIRVKHDGRQHAVCYVHAVRAVSVVPCVRPCLKYYDSVAEAECTNSKKNSVPYNICYR